MAADGRPGAGITVLVDACSHRGGGGISYLRTLLPALAVQPGIDAVTTVVEPGSVLACELAGTRVRVERRTPGRGGLAGRLLWEATVLQRRSRGTVVLAPSAMLPRSLPAPVVAVPQNILPFTGIRPRELIQRLAIARTLSSATGAIFVSQAMRDRVAASTAIPELEAVIPCALDDAFLEPHSPAAVRDGIVVIADRLAHKRLSLALAAWGRLAEPRPALTVIGAEPHDGAGAGPGIRFERWLAPERVAAALRGARLALLPSRAESFGLPALEALACGARVIASDLAALRETTGGHARLLSGGADEWASAIRQELALAHDPRPGREWAARFTARRTAAASAELLLEAARRAGRAARRTGAAG
jgi:glycosyltransferase involved in cell wall biosynthesis